MVLFLITKCFRLFTGKQYHWHTQKGSHIGNVRTEVYTLLFEENPFEKGFFLKLLS